jgi:hypothetical protein
LQGTPKFTQIGIFGLKIYHLATLAVLVMKRLEQVKQVSGSDDRQLPPFKIELRNT